MEELDGPGGGGNCQTLTRFNPNYCPPNGEFLNPMNSKIRKHVHPAQWLGSALLPLLFLLTPALVSAQSDEEEAGDETDVYELSPFVVETRDDRGYQATNTTAATALNTALRDLPVSIEVVTRNFLDDIQATDMKEGLAYTPGVFMEKYEDLTSANTGQSQDMSPSQAVGANEFNDAVIIRGYTVPNQQRLGFRIGTIVPAYHIALGGITDNANTARQEVVRGPQSLLYGINVLSGVVNIVPRRPLSEPRTEVTLSMGSENYRRAVLDNSGPLRDGLNYRVIGSYQSNDEWIDFKTRERKYYAGQLEWRITPKLNLFLEAQYSDDKISGHGQQFYVDDGKLVGNAQSTNPYDNFQFTNPYDQNFTFGRDFFNDLVFSDNRELPLDEGLDVGMPVGELAGLGLVPEGTEYLVPAGTEYLVKKENGDYQFPDLGRFYNISGPDTYRQRKEFDFIGLLNWSPFKNFDVELGTMYADVDDQERNVTMGMFTGGTGSTGTVDPGGPNLEPSEPRAAYYYNPEYDPNDLLGFGPGELFIYPDNRLNNSDDALSARKYAYYSWYERPTTAETWQFRTRLAYTFETSWLKDRIDGRHTVSGGLQSTRDQVSFVDMKTDIRNIYSWDNRLTNTKPRNPDVNRLAEDPFIFRSSIFDYSPIRYDPSLGELAIIGAPRTGGMPNISQVDGYIQRSGWIDATLWYRGKYAVYHGRYFNERLNIIFGLREDAYQVEEKERIRIIDRDLETDRWQGSGSSILIDEFAGYGDQPYTWNPDLPDSLNQKVQNDIERFRVERPQGLITKNFEETERYNSKTFGISYAFTESLSGYFLFSEGIFPNSGQRDGANRPFTAERSTNKEIGLKFDILDQKISGRIAYWEIDRENAVWSWSAAPNTQSWWGAPGQADTETSGSFSPRRVDLYLEDPTHSEAYDIRYGVAKEYVYLAFEKLGLPIPAERAGRINIAAYKQYGVTNYASQPSRDPQYEQKGYTFFFANYHDMKAIDAESNGQNPIKLAFDLAMKDNENLQLGGFPIYYYGLSVPDEGGGYGHNASSGAGRGANVGFEEKGTGFDGQIFITPVPNYQIIFGFSQQSREVTSFTLVSGHLVDDLGNKSERQYTTEYDEWVFLLGSENFEDPRDPSTLKSGAIHGLDLSFVPEYNFSVWNKYTFVEGPLERLELGLGVNYSSSVTTTTGVGGNDLRLNPFTTPDVPERTRFDTYIAYRFGWGRSNWRLALNVYNVLDDDVGLAYATYQTADGRTETRRTRQYYDPRSFRFSVSVAF